MFGATAWMRASAKAQAEKLERERLAAGMPEAPCCVVWRGKAGESDFPWELEGDVRAAYPPLAQKLGVEGFAVVDFEVGADGAAKNLHCADYWPSRLFYDSAAEALRAARFRLRRAPAHGSDPVTAFRSFSASAARRACATRATRR
ncbi:MAG: energy transducer TonB [Alphaproteobacteria bacterium]